MLNQGVGYAATALGYVAATGGKPVLVREIAKACDIPAPYLAKIIHALSKAGVVITQRGVGGGVTLGRESADISLYDLCEALGDPIIEERCMLGTSDCSDARACPAHQFTKTDRERRNDFLRNMTVADIAAFEIRRRWTTPAGQ